MQKNSKLIVEIPAGAFYIHDKKNQAIIPYSDGAFGCCYLIAEEADKILIAHINAQTVMLETIADKTVQEMLGEFKKLGADIYRSKVTIVHSNKFKEYEEAQEQKTEIFRLTNSYKEKSKDNMVMEPFANEFLERALMRAKLKDIKVIKDFNSNLVDFVANPMLGTKKTDICFFNGKIHLQNYHSNQCPSKEEWQKPDHEHNWQLWKSEVKEQTTGAQKVFDKIQKAQKNGTAITISAGDWRPVHNFYLHFREGLDTGQILQDGVRFHLSKTASKDFEDKMNDHQFVVVNMNIIVKEHLKSNFKKPTISSLIKDSKDIIPQISQTFQNQQDKSLTLANKKQDRSFVYELVKKRQKEADNNQIKSK